MKKMLTSQELIEYMKNKGITFNIISEVDAKIMLNKVNYYFKVTSYRNNFSKDVKGKYKNLDFAYLTDLASIDMQLRDYLFDMSIDIEHSTKVLLLNLISNDPQEDGYSIVNDFKNKYPSHYSKTFEYLSTNKYLHDMYLKHRSNVSIWVFLEVTTFGTLSLFVNFYLERKNTKSVRQIHNYLRFTKNIRNACAHSNPLLVNIFSDKELLKHPSAPVKSAARKMNIPTNYLQDLKINDLVSLFFIHKNLQSKKMGEHRHRQGKRLIKRFHRHEDWYSNNYKLNTFFKILSKLIDYLENT
ncbi:Abi family protein [Companilactobacillus muriivasis]|uniref:Abi family protein n=1 Tax=Companilactobacillus muriivasis TaxID=3081444 RepID=UPI0030C6EC66